MCSSDLLPTAVGKVVLAFGTVTALAGLAPSYGIYALALPFCGFTALIMLSSANAFVQGTCDPAYRGRVMGIRMLAIYGLPMGLIIAGAMIDHIGFSLTNLIFVLTGLILLASISLIWRKDLLDTAAIANQK
mgnify:CR=1 FL=1